MTGKVKASILIVFLLSSLCSFARRGDSITISLLTCTPGEEVYASFGHSAIRVKSDSLPIFRNRNYAINDVVFNYGMFNYNSDNFIYRFVKGETDYELGAEEMSFFMGRYAQKGDGVTEQVLKLTSEEKEALLNLLYQNFEPQNRMYRYNFLYDNCTTRARDIIEKAIDGHVRYSSDLSTSAPEHDYDYNVHTMRDILHQFTAKRPWLEFGIDFVLGAEVDEVFCDSCAEKCNIAKTFIPAFYEHYAQQAEVERKGVNDKLVEERNEILKKQDRRETETLLTPLLVFWVLFIVTVLVSLKEHCMYRKGKIKTCMFWIYDSFLLLAQGLAGVIVAFLYFFSEHPAVGTNWLVFIFNPLPLLWLPYFIHTSRKHEGSIVSVLSSIALCVFVVVIMPLSPQSYNNAIYPLVLTLLFRSLIRTLRYDKSSIELILTKCGFYRQIRDCKTSLLFIKTTKSRRMQSVKTDIH